MNTIHIDDELREALIMLIKKRAEYDVAVASATKFSAKSEDHAQAINFHQHRMSHELAMHQSYVGLLIEQKFCELIHEWC